MLRRLDVARRFGQNLTRCRERVNLSQEELGYRASLHRTEVSLLERGARIPRVDTVVRLAGSLSAPVNDLVAGIGWTPGSTQTVEGGFELDEQIEGVGEGAPEHPASDPAQIGTGGQVA